MINVLYIAGAGRSGSTLLERILGQLPGCVAVGELRHLWREDPAATRCGCGRPLIECDFWRGVTSRAGVPFSAEGFRAMQQAQKRVDRMRYIPRMLFDSPPGRSYAREHAAYTETLRRLYCAIHETTGAEVIADSSKDISTLFLLSGMADARVQILHLIRDSRAVAYSWTKEKVRPHAVNRISYMPRYSPQRSAADWMYRNILTEAARGRAAGYLRLRYEELVTDPRGATRQIAHFMGIHPVDLGFISGSEIKFSEGNHAIAGNPMQFETGNVQIRLDSAWRQDFQTVQRRIVTALTWPLLFRYGYR